MKALEAFQPPTTKTELMSYLGMIVWYARFIPHLAQLATLLRKLLENPKEGTEHIWEIDKIGTDQNKSFLALKQALTQEPILKLPDWRKPFFLITDASQARYGAVLA